MDNAVLKTIRWFFAGILAILLFVMLGVLAVGTSVSFEVTQKENVKDAIEQAGIYENAIPVAVDTILERLGETASDTGEEIAPDDILNGITTKDEIKESLQRVFPPEWLQEEAEAAIDEVYAFLSGEQDEINIEIDLSEKEDEIYAAIASIFKERLNALPDCGYNATGGLGNLDIMEAECLPDNIDRQEAADLIDKEVRNIPFVENQTISFNLLEGDAGQAEPVRRMFFFAKFAPLLAWSLVLVLVALLFALVPHDKNKMYTQGVLWGLSGMGLALAVVTAKAQFDNIFLQLESRAGEGISPELAAFIKEVVFVVYSGIANKILIFAAVYLALGTAFFLLARNKEDARIFKYIKYAFGAIALLGIAGAVFILINANEEGIFEPANMENVQMQEQFNGEGGNQPHEAGDGERFRGGGDNDPNASSEL